jgi:hypothetical protein
VRLQIFLLRLAKVARRPWQLLQRARTDVGQR